MTFETAVTYLLPPLLGAVIGYVTNYVAIRMLFRPLRPWRLFGLRVPMTPGIIPAKRGELAARMGEMVGRHLLTPDDVERTLDRETFRRELKTTVAEKLRTFLDRDLGPVIDLVPPVYRPRFSDLVDAVAGKLADSITRVLHSEAFADRFRMFVVRRSDALFERDLESCLAAEDYQAARAHVDRLISRFLASDEVAGAVGRFVDDRTGRWLRSEKPLRALLPEDLVTLLLDQLEKEVPPLLEKFGGLLYDPDFRRRLTLRMRQGIEKFLDSLGGLAGLLSGFINLDKVYARIPETLDQVSEEVARWLKEEKTRAQIAGMLRDRMEGFLDRPLSEYVEKMPFEKVDGMQRFLRERAIAMLQRRKTVESLLGLMERGVDAVRDRSFGSLADALLPENGRRRVVDAIGERLLALLRSDAVAAEIRSLAQRQLRSMLCERPIGRIAARVPADVSEEIEAILLQQLSEVLKREVPVLIDTLNIRQMVEDKVNSLDLLEVEELLLGVMREQFRYINLFGALLGFLIGLLNLLVLRLHPF